MIESFLASWELFHNAYLAGLGIAATLSLLGVIAVARNQIFVGAAIAQASTLGIALALWLAGALGGAAAGLLESEAFAASLSVAFSLGATFATTRGSHETAEERTGLVFLLGASFSILLLSRSPHGLEEIHRLVASSVIGATRADVWIFASLAVATAAGALLGLRRLLLVTLDPPLAEALGMRVGVWSALLAAWLGVAVGLSIRVSGVLYAFGCLVLPALLAKSLCRELRSMFLVSPALALAASAVGFVVADAYDYPPAQLTVAILSLALCAVWLLGGRRSRSTP